LPEALGSVSAIDRPNVVVKPGILDFLDESLIDSILGRAEPVGPTRAQGLENLFRGR
jgi:hypothetical protein